MILKLITMQRDAKEPHSPKIPRYSDRFKDRIRQSAQKYAQLFKPVEPPPQSAPPKDFFFLRVKSIGVGAHSFVYLVQEDSSNLLLAEKAITREHARQIEQDIVREVKVQSMCDHENLVKLYHIYSSPTHINLVMEFAQDSLFNLKQQFTIFKEKEVLQVVRQILNGLSYLHQRKIVHADIKLENVMIANGVVKLCDFGYAHQEGTEKGGTVGTMEYLPPQYAQGQDSGTHRDVWAVGIMAFEMLVGKTPFGDLSQSQKWSKLMKTPPQTYLKQLIHLQRQIGRQSPRVQQVLSHIFTDWRERWSAERLLTLPGLSASDKK